VEHGGTNTNVDAIFIVLLYTLINAISSSSGMKGEAKLRRHRDKEAEGGRTWTLDDHASFGGT
jgi:hypothetical protein